MAVKSQSLLTSTATFLKALRSRNQSGRLWLFAVLDLGPKCGPIEGAAKLAVVTSRAVSRSQGAKLKLHSAAGPTLIHVQTSWSVTGFATHVDQFRSLKLTSIPRWLAETDCMAADATGVSVRPFLDQSSKSMGMLCLAPGLAGCRVA